MLYIITKDGEISWHVGNGPLNMPFSKKVIMIQADGDELEYILDEFSNLPRNHLKRVIKWFGDDAMFIAHNLT